MPVTGRESLREVQATYTYSYLLTLVNYVATRITSRYVYPLGTWARPRVLHTYFWNIYEPDLFIREKYCAKLPRVSFSRASYGQPSEMIV